MPENRYTLGAAQAARRLHEETSRPRSAALPSLATGIECVCAEVPRRKYARSTSTPGRRRRCRRAYQAAQLIAQQWRQLGLDVDVKPLQRQAQTQLIWFSRDKWDVTMWRMVGRPERSDPDEFLYSLYHSSYAEKGYNFIGYINPEYDALAEKQRTQLDREERRKTAFAMQEIINRDQPQAFLVHPKYAHGLQQGGVQGGHRRQPEPASASATSGPSSTSSRLGAQKDLIINSNETINATNPLYIGGAVDSWVTDLIWDRLMRIGPDGMPRPWAAEKVDWVDDKTVEIKLRAGMKWHDGKPVTVDDVIFSFTAPAGDKAPMYKPFVTDIASMEKVGDYGPALQAQERQHHVPHRLARQDQPDPQAHLGAGAEGPRGQAGDRRAAQGRAA